MLQNSIEFYLDLQHRRNHFQLCQVSERLQKAFRRVDAAVPAEVEPLVHAEIHGRRPVDHTVQKERIQPISLISWAMTAAAKGRVEEERDWREHYAIAEVTIT